MRKFFVAQLTPSSISYKITLHMYDENAVLNFKSIYYKSPQSLHSRINYSTKIQFIWENKDNTICEKIIQYANSDYIAINQFEGVQ